VYVHTPINCNPALQAIPLQIQHNFSTFFTAETRENAVDKVAADGQNPYHSRFSPSMTVKCKHPIVKIVAREDDAEFVECQSCGEVFDSAEFSDIAIEEEEALAETPRED
jgi:hypothetical protein